MNREKKKYAIFEQKITKAKLTNNARHTTLYPTQMMLKLACITLQTYKHIHNTMAVSTMAAAAIITKEQLVTTISMTYNM